jgi:prepilin-type N-terminal cleavage/methylation domain-containing protein
MQRHNARLSAKSMLRRAYTLVEVLIVVAVLGLAAAVLVPSMSGRGDFDTQAAVRALIADITFAQSDALANQELRRVHFYEDGSGWCLIRVDESELGEPFDPSTADYLHDPLQGSASDGAYAVRLTDGGRYASVRVMGVSIDGGGRNITFDELGGTVAPGGLPGTGGTLILRSPDAAYRLEISALTGKVRVMRLADAQVSAD